MDDEMIPQPRPLEPCRQKVSSKRVKQALKAFVGVCSTAAAATMLSTAVNCTSGEPPLMRLVTQCSQPVTTRATTRPSPATELTTTPFVTGGVIAVHQIDAPGGKTWAVRKDDTLYSIAQVTLGDAKRWPEIKAVNPGLDEKALPVGKTIKIPAE
jgi:nucleoid-associated protein YgaU